MYIIAITAYNHFFKHRPYYLLVWIFYSEYVFQLFGNIFFSISSLLMKEANSDVNISYWYNLVLLLNQNKLEMQCLKETQILPALSRPQTLCWGAADTSGCGCILSALCKSQGRTCLAQNIHIAEGFCMAGSWAAALQRALCVCVHVCIISSQNWGRQGTSTRFSATLRKLHYFLSEGLIQDSREIYQNINQPGKVDEPEGRL